jgi:cyclin E
MVLNLYLCYDIMYSCEKKTLTSNPPTTFYSNKIFVYLFNNIFYNIISGVTCLFIAAKIEEIYPPKLQEFAYVTDGACAEEEILSMELVILKGLNWGLSPMTPNSWVKLYMQVNKANYIVEINGGNPPDNEDLVLPQYSGKSFSKVMQLLDLCILDIGSLSFPYSVLSASALYHCQDQITALQSSGMELLL